MKAITEAYKLNKEIEQFVLDMKRTNTIYSIQDLAYVNQYIGYGGMWKLDTDLKGTRGLYEYYTPASVIEKMVGLAVKHGYENGKVLEPSCGIGRFLHYFAPNAEVTGIEIDEISAAICKANFPTFDIKKQSFNALFVDRRGNSVDYKPEYDLVIGNPPYGEFSGRNTTREKKATKANNFVEYFISRGLDLLNPNGVLAYIVPSAFLFLGENEAKNIILQKADLVEAYRLPYRIFDYTDINTDIVVFKKK
ncbi:MAG: N-6 DNA methylase [Bacteroidota bacterium]